MFPPEHTLPPRRTPVFKLDKTDLQGQACSFTDMFENVFNTVNMSYKRQRATSCAESMHPGFLDETPGVVNTDYKIGFTTTGAGRRYVYSSLPEPVIKMGTIRMVNNNSFGIPQMNSAVFHSVAAPVVNGLHNTQPLSAQTFSIGAATKNESTDYVYTAPTSDPTGWDVIGFTVADQWDGTGGVRYILLQAPGSPGKKYDKTKAKKLRWNKMEGGGYVPSAAGGYKSGLKDLTKTDIKVIAGDGRGSVYYLTSPRTVHDKNDPATFWHPNSTLTNPIPLTVANKPEGPFVESGVNVWKWKRKTRARIASELYQIEYYNGTEKKENDFKVGEQDAMFLETFRTPDASDEPLVGPAEALSEPDDIPLALATINLAGPPSGNNEKMCVDIVSSNVTPVDVNNVKKSDLAPIARKDITTTTRGGGVLGESKIMGDEIEEDKQYRCYMENSPPKFIADDVVKKNIKSGSALEDVNDNGAIGGFDFAIRPATACYYWRVEMVEPMKKIIDPNTSFKTSRTGTEVTASVVKVTAAMLPSDWVNPAGVTITDGTWYCSQGVNSKVLPSAENSLAAEASPDFAFTPNEPGIYKVSLIATARKWNYGVLSYPSYITDRETKPGCKDAKTHLLFFDNGAGGGTAGNGVKDGAEGDVAERYVVVTAKKTEPDRYITNIKITGDSTINENQPGVWKASAKIRFVKAFNHEQGDMSAQKLMTTYNGIGCWDYPDDAVTAWGLGPSDGGEDYTTGAPARPSNSKKDGANTIVEPLLRNFGEKAPGSNTLTAVPPELAGVPLNLIFGKPGTDFPTWVVGAGTSANPTTPLNKADRGCIEYEWYLAAEEMRPDGTSIFHKTAIEPAAAGINPPVDRLRPDILIAKGRLSDEKTFVSGEKAVKWSSFTDAGSGERTFDVEVNLRYAFDMPLDPGKYYLYIVFKHPKVKWEGRSQKLSKTGTPMNNPDGSPIFAYYDLVPDGTASTKYNTLNWGPETYHDNNQIPAGFAITVKDLQPPQAFFISGKNTDPKEDAVLNGDFPAVGVGYDGGTTGDPFRGKIAYNVCDNNPNKEITSTLKAMTGTRQKSLAWTEFGASKGLRESEDVYLVFTDDKVTKVLQKTLHPLVDLRPPGVVQDITEEVTIVDMAVPVTNKANRAIRHYAGYGVDAPYRRAMYVLDNPQNAFTKDHIPYDMVGNIPLYAAGADGSNNKMSDFDRDGNFNDLEDKVNQGATTATSSKTFPNAPAYISIIDNDAPSLRFYALRSRDNIYREYIMTATGALDNDDNQKPVDHPANHDELDWDPAQPDKLRFTSFGQTDASVKDHNLADGAIATLPNQGNPVLETISLPNNDGRCTQFKPSDNGVDIGVGNIGGKQSYVVKFKNANVGITETYSQYSPNNVAFYDFDRILPDQGKMLELIEDARTRFEITVVDNVDNTITLAPPQAVAAGAAMTANCYVDTKDLGDAATLAEVMGSWKTKGTKVETYGIFRDQTQPGNTPYMLMIVKDSTGNATVAKLPLIILHTLFRPNVINVDTRRSD